MFLDIALGTIASLLTITWFDMELTWWFILLGAVFALLPDLDFLVMLAQRGFKRDRRFDHEHRELLHKPLIYIPIGSLFTYTVGGAPLATLFATGSAIHFLHDSTGVGWGIRWLYPFSKNYIGFCHRGLRSICNFKWIQSVPADKIVTHIQATLNKSHDWIAENYLRPSVTLITEMLVLVLAIIALVFYLK